MRSSLVSNQLRRLDIWVLVSETFLNPWWWIFFEGLLGGLDIHV